MYSERNSDNGYSPFARGRMIWPAWRRLDKDASTTTNLASEKDPIGVFEIMIFEIVSPVQ